MSDDIVVNMNFNLGKDQTVADIVTLLRKYQPYSKLHGQAADEIERLRQENELLLLKRPSSAVIDDISSDRDRWKRIAESLATKIAAENWTDSRSVIEQAGGNQ